MQSLIFLLLPPCCIALTLCLLSWGMAEATYRRSRKYALACLYISAAFFFDIILHASAYLTTTEASICIRGHALIALPIQTIQFFFFSMAGLSLFHRHQNTRLLTYTGLIPACIMLIMLTLRSTIWGLQNRNWSEKIDAMASSPYGNMLFAILLILFFITCIESIYCILKSLYRYRRQINSYFAFHHFATGRILTIASYLYITFIMLMILSVTPYLGIFFFKDILTIYFITISGKILFFLYIGYLFIRHYRRYLSIEPALNTIDEIDKEVENQNTSVTAETQQKPGNTPDIAETPLPSNHITIPTNATPDLSTRLEEWANDSQKHYLREDINVIMTAEMLHVKPRLLSEYLNTVMGVNFNSYINSLRIEEAKKLIHEDPNRTFNDIAVYTGFSSAASFCKTFKKNTGITPTQYRNNLYNC